MLISAKMVRTVAVLLLLIQVEGDPKVFQNLLKQVREFLPLPL